MDQRDGVTAVTATRYPFGSQEERGGGGPSRAARGGGGGRAPSRRHGRHSLRSAAQPRVPAARLGLSSSLLPLSAAAVVFSGRSRVSASSSSARGVELRRAE